jgi:tRNA (mo5U34)-methyltransferase
LPFDPSRERIGGQIGWVCHMSDVLAQVKSQEWFYEFLLPDGSETKSYIPEHVRGVHVTREKALRKYLSEGKGQGKTALDISCHEGFFSLILSDYFSTVVGVDKNEKSLVKARQVVELFDKPTIQLRHAKLESLDEKDAADFVLCYGLLYHVENPVEVLRSLARITKQSLCIETQVLPFQVSGVIEDGSYGWQRNLQGTFGVCVDYSDRPEGGVTDIALVPSVDALVFILRQFGFSTIELYKPEASDYEQFVRGHRVILLAQR